MSHEVIYNGRYDGVTKSELGTLLGELVDIQETDGYRVDWSNVVLDAEPEKRRVVMGVALETEPPTLDDEMTELADTIVGLSVDIEPDAASAKENIDIN